VCDGCSALTKFLLQHFLNRAIDPPEVSAMDKAWNVLEELGAIDADGRLTALGRHIVRDCSRVSCVHCLTDRHAIFIVNATRGFATREGWWCIEFGAE
jgi:hypothetical protein